MANSLVPEAWDLRRVRDQCGDQAAEIFDTDRIVTPSHLLSAPGRSRWLPHSALVNWRSSGSSMPRVRIEEASSHRGGQLTSAQGNHGLLNGSSAGMDDVAVEAFGLPSQERGNLAGQRCDLLRTGGRVVCFPVRPQLCQPNRVRVIESCVDTVSEEAAVAAGAESVQEQCDQLVTPTRQRGHSPEDTEHGPTGHARSPFR